jgi:hypothetical protein
MLRRSQGALYGGTQRDLPERQNMRTGMLAAHDPDGRILVLVLQSRAAEVH